MADRVAHYLVDYRPNLLFALRRYRPERYVHGRQLNPDQLLVNVLTSQRVQRLIVAVAAREDKPVGEVTKDAHEVLKDISHQLSVPSARPVVYLTVKLGAFLFESITMNMDGLEKWRQLAKEVPLVFVPSHRSYLDFILVSVFCFAHDIGVPLIVAGEDFKKMTFIGSWLRRCGAFYMQRSFSKDIFYKTIFSEYVREIMNDGSNPMEFFIEGTRSRTGKALHPKMGIIGYIFEQFFQGVVGDFAVCPVSISYERTLEEDSHVLNLLGVGKPPEGSSSMIHGIHNVIQKCNGRIRIHLAEPFRVQEEYSKKMDRLHHSQVPRTEDFAQLLKDDGSGSGGIPSRKWRSGDKQLEAVLRAERRIVRNCSYRVVGMQQAHMVIYPRYMVASIMLQTIGRQLTLAHLTREVLWLKQHLLALGAQEVLVDEENASEDVHRAVELLRPPLFIDEERQIVRVQEDVAFVTRPNTDLSVQCEHARSYPVVFDRAAIELQLVYPHNQMVHIIHDVSILSVLLAIHPNDYPRATASHEFAVLAGVLRDEFVFGVSDADPTVIFDNAVERLAKCRAISVNTVGQINVSDTGKKLIDYLAKTVHPLLATVWVFGVSILKLSASQPNAFFVATTSIPQAQLDACKLLAQGQLTFYRCVGKEILKSALQSLVHCGLLVRDADSDNIRIGSGQRPTLVRVINMVGEVLRNAGQRVPSAASSPSLARL